MKKYLLFLLVVVVAGCTQSGADQAPAESSGMQDDASATNPVSREVMENGLIIEDHNIGEGAEAAPGDSVYVHYTGWLYDESLPGNKGDKFDSSVDRGQPFGFPLGKGRVIAGWDQGVAGMKVGGHRTLTIPSELGYGERGIGPIPPGATLVFDVELLEVQKLP